MAKTNLERTRALRERDLKNGVFTVEVRLSSVDKDKLDSLKSKYHTHSRAVVVSNLINEVYEIWNSK